MLAALALHLSSLPAGAQLRAPAGGHPDPRASLRAGWMDAGQAARHLELIASRPRPTGFYDAASPGEFALWNTDLAFSGNHVFVGSYRGFNVYDVSDPSHPRLRTSVVCPGGQGDVSVHGDLLFFSVEETRGRRDCGAQGTSGAVDPARFRGLRIFDISDLDAPRQVAAVQTCRGSHTHTVLRHPDDNEHVYVYVSGTAPSRPPEELAGCRPKPDAADPSTPYWSISVVQVPLSAPQMARVVAEPRVFADAATGEIAGLWKGGAAGAGAQTTAQTDQCHDITVFPELGLAAGACSGNGILLDISDPTNPVRIDEVFDPNFAYWHSATFSNDGTKVVFTDEWGGGSAARCQATDPPSWGANAIFEIVDRKLRFTGYYKLPAPQGATENCVAHNGSLIPVPGRDIMVQAWYQGGISIIDFTDPANPSEIAFFDRGPVDPERIQVGGHWSAYWHDGYIYASEMVRGLDVLALRPSEYLTANEIEAARQVRTEEFNPQWQSRIVWRPSFAVARAYLDQLGRNDGLPEELRARTATELDRAERLAGTQRTEALRRLARQLERGGRPSDARRVKALSDVLRELAETA